MADPSEEMLINLNSPEKSNNAPCQKTYLKNPLIPGPDVNCNIEINNPFDIVANSAENWDPFELVLRESLKKIDTNHNNQAEKGAKCKMFKTPSPRRKKHDDNSRKVLRSHSVTENVMYFNSSSTKPEELNSHIEAQPADETCSIRERIRNVVKQRGSENTMTPSLSQPDLRKNEGNSPLKCMNDMISQILGKSMEVSIQKGAESRNELQYGNNIYQEVMLQKNRNPMDLEMTFQNKSSVLIEIGNQTRSYAAQKFETSLEELSKKEDLHEILEEAKQMSFVFRNLSVSEPSKAADVMDSLHFKHCNEESLMDIKPPWEENDESSISSESEDSSIGLPKIKLFYMKKREKKGQEISSEELENYKKRIRASIDGNVSCDEELPSDETQPQSQETADVKSTKSSPTEKEPLPLEALAVNIPPLPEVSSLRPKKKENILKKGPMKALVPLQKMTKSIAEKMSPRKKSSQTSSSSMKTKQDSSFSSSLIYPVAASTPNGKNSSKGTSSNSPVVSKTSIKNRLSRKDSEPVVKTGTAKRSVSLSSSSRNTNGKLPFTSVNSNVKQNASRFNRPHTAPSNTKSNSSPQTKDNSLRNVKPLASNDKENRMQVF